MNLAERVRHLIDGTLSVDRTGLDRLDRLDLPLTHGRSDRAWAIELAEQDTITYGEVRA